MGMTGWIVIALILILIVSVFIFDQMHSSVIREHIISQGGTVLSIAWNPFESGGIGAHTVFVYVVRFRDSDGNIHEALAMTNNLGGRAYLSNDVTWVFTLLTHPQWVVLGHG